jgi:galactonate dehydratase
MTAISSGIDQALWDIKGKVYDVPIFKLLGGPTRDTIRVDRRVNAETGVKAVKIGSTGLGRTTIKYIEGQKYVDAVVDNFKAACQQYGSEVDSAIDFHGAVQPPTAALLIKALEPYQPFFYEEVVQCLNVVVMAELAHKTHIPLATGECIFTWGFRKIIGTRGESLISSTVRASTARNRNEWETC